MTQSRLLSPELVDSGGTYCETVFMRGPFSLSIGGSWGGTLTVQRNYGTDWTDIESFTANTEKYGNDPAGAFYRVGFKATAWTSGSASVFIGQ